MHFWLAAERQQAWARNQLDDPSAGFADMPPTRELFRTVWEVDRTWMPKIRTCARKRSWRKAVRRLASVEEIDAFVKNL
jgi:hypothetical protein